MTPFSWTKELDRDGHRVLFSGQPFAMHCHHYNINLQKTLEDALADQGVRLLLASTESAAYENFTNLVGQYPSLKSDASKFEMAALLFQNSGLGILSVQRLGPEASTIISPSSHHVTGWLAKFGRRHTPGCHFTRGWLAGVLAAIYERQPGSYEVTETACKMMRNRECVFKIKER